MYFESRWVMVTGASSGLGLEMSRQLARNHRANLVLVARRAERLASIKDELERTYGVSVRVIAADLSRESEVERVFHDATREQDLYGAILNAGVTHFGEHLELSWPEFKALLDTNVNAVGQLTHQFLPYLIEKRQGGGLMLVASMAGVTPVPYQAAYSGTKAFIVAFGHSLWHELKDQDVSVTTFVPGGIATEMIGNSGLSHHFGGGPFLQDVESCASDAITAFQRRRHTYVPGLMNQVGVVASKLLPRSVMVGQVAAEYRKALAKKKRK